MQTQIYACIRGVSQSVGATRLAPFHLRSRTVHVFHSLLELHKSTLSNDGRQCARRYLDVLRDGLARTVFGFQSLTSRSR